MNEQLQATLIEAMGSDKKKCRACEKELDVSLFPVRKDRSGRLRPYCQECSNSIERARYLAYKRSNPFRLKAVRMKLKAKRDGVPFDLTPEYLESIWTGVCPVSGLEISLTTDKRDEKTAELDRFIPDKGYVQGNVNFLSRRINRIKSDITAEEAKNLASWMEKVKNV